MYLYRVTIGLEGVRRSYRTKATTAAKAARAALEYDQRLKAGKLGQEVTVAIMRLDRPASDQRSQVVPVREAEINGGG